MMMRSAPRCWPRCEWAAPCQYGPKTLYDVAWERKPGRPRTNAAESEIAEPIKSRDITWRIENPSKNRFVLRNTSSDIAEHVEVNAERAGIARNLPRAAIIRPGEGVDMLLIGAFGHPIPNQLYVRWGGQPDWVAVPLQPTY
jgi:hypothetical protein